MISALKNLRLVPVEALLLHEACDRRRLAQLREQVEAEGVQRNPVIVCCCGDSCLVLDGAHRVHALRELGCELILVQLVEPPQAAEGWGHLLEAGSLRRALRRARERARGIEIEVSSVSGGETARPWIARADLGGERTFVRAREAGLLPEVRALWRLQGLYAGGELVRRVEPNSPVELADGEGLLRYRSFAPEELVELARAGEVLPAGVTRFRVRERVLGVRFPIQKMRGGTAEARNAELRESIKHSWDQNRIRYYAEPVVLFE